MDIQKRFIIFISAVIILGMGLLASRMVVSRAAGRADRMPRGVEQQILSFELANYADSGIKKWKLKGDSADVMAEIVNLNNIFMETYEDPKITLTAKAGTYNKDNKEVSLFRNVEVMTSDGAMLMTEYLKWDGNTDTITTDEPVRMIRSDVVARGKGALAMPQMKKIVLDRDINVKLTTKVIDDFDTGFSGSEPVDPEKKLSQVTITCNGPLVLDYEKNIALFEENVLVDDGRGKIYSDKMEAHLDPTSKNIVKVVAEGGVRVVRGNESTYSEKAIYTTKDRKIILVGKPRIYIEAPEELKKVEDDFEEI